MWCLNLSHDWSGSTFLEVANAHAQKFCNDSDSPTRTAAAANVIDIIIFIITIVVVDESHVCTLFTHLGVKIGQCFLRVYSAIIQKCCSNTTAIDREKKNKNWFSWKIYLFPKFKVGSRRGVSHLEPTQQEVWLWVEPPRAVIGTSWPNCLREGVACLIWQSEVWKPYPRSSTVSKKRFFLCLSSPGILADHNYALQCWNFGCSLFKTDEPGNTPNHTVCGMPPNYFRRDFF